MTKADESSFASFIKGSYFSSFILFIVFFNAIIIGFQSFPQLDISVLNLLNIVDLICLAIFTLEIIMKLFVYRGSFFKDGWNVFDFIIIALSLLLIGSSFISVLRILRVLRILKTISYIKSLRRVTTSLFMAVPTIGSIALLLCIVLFVFGVIGHTLYADISPHYFGDLSKSLITLFQIATFDDWANIYRPIAEQTSFSIIFFIAYILVVVFIILNLVVGEIVNNAAKLTEGEHEEIHIAAAEVAATANPEQTAIQLAELRAEIRELKQLIQKKRED